MTLAAMTWQASGLGAALGSPLVMMVIVMGIFYVMLILPQQRQRKKLQEMLGAIKAGDKVITNGGIYGVINGIDGDREILKIANNGDPQDCRHPFIPGKNPHPAFCDHEGGGIGRCEISPPAARQCEVLSDHESQPEVESDFYPGGHSRLPLWAFR